MTIFYCSFLFAELPSQIIGKKLGPDVWIPIQMILWSAVAMSQAAMHGKTGFFICRWLLGMLEGGKHSPAPGLYSVLTRSQGLSPTRFSIFRISTRIMSFPGVSVGSGRRIKERRLSVLFWHMASSTSGATVGCTKVGGISS